MPDLNPGDRLLELIISILGDIRVLGEEFLESWAMLSQRFHTRVRDFIAVAQVEPDEVGALQRNCFDGSIRNVGTPAAETNG